VTSILRSFYMASPNSLGWSLQYGLDNLPVGFKCTSITAQISDLQITRAYGAKNASTINNGVVEFDAAGSRLGVRLLGPDGVMYASHEVRPPPFVISLQPGDVRRYGVPYDWNSYQSNGQSNPGPETMTPTQPPIFEGPPAQWPQPQVWRMELDDLCVTNVLSGDARTDHRTVVSALCVVQFNHDG
jgi:hypothetical protein